MEVLERLLSVVRRCCEVFPDKRTGTNSRYAMADIGLAAFSVFFAQSPSFLDHQRRLETGHGCSNCQTLFGIGRIPTDNHGRLIRHLRLRQTCCHAQHSGKRVVQRSSPAARQPRRRSVPGQEEACLALRCCDLLGRHLARELCTAPGQGPWLPIMAGALAGLLRYTLAGAADVGWKVLELR